MAQNSRLRMVYSNSEITHIWMHQKQRQARNSQNSLYFNGRVIYSYGSHFPIARITSKGGHKIVLVTIRTFSHTTCQHISIVENSIPQSIPRFYVEDVTKRNVLQQLLRRTHETWEIVRRKHDKEHMIEAWEILRRSAIQFAKMGGKTINPLMPSDYDDQRELAANYSRKRRAKYLAEQVEREKREKEGAKVFKVKFDKRLKTWLKGRCATSLLQSVSRYQSRIYLRLVRRNRFVETSLGVIVPIEAAIRLWRLANFCRKKNLLVSYPSSRFPIFEIGGYTVERIEPNGDVTAGCHNLSWNMMSRMARILKVGNEKTDPRTVKPFEKH